MPMTVYWVQNNIPALRGLSADEKAAAVKATMPKVYRHWQVWLPLALLAITIFAFVFLAPHFQGRTLVLFAGAFLLGKLTQLPINNYLQWHLEGKGAMEDALKATE